MQIYCFIVRSFGLFVVEVEFEMLAAVRAGHFALFKHSFSELDSVAAGWAAYFIKLFFVIVIIEVIVIIVAVVVFVIIEVIFYVR